MIPYNLLDQVKGIQAATRTVDAVIARQTLQNNGQAGTRPVTEYILTKVRVARLSDSEGESAEAGQESSVSRWSLGFNPSEGVKSTDEIILEPVSVTTNLQTGKITAVVGGIRLQVENGENLDKFRTYNQVTAVSYQANKVSS
jgi:hypothetical protein